MGRTQKKNLKSDKKVIKIENIKNNKKIKVFKKQKSPKRNKISLKDILSGNNEKKNKINKKNKENHVNNIINNNNIKNKNNIKINNEKNININNSKKRKENPNKTNNEIPKRKKMKLQNKRKQPPQDININDEKNDNINNLDNHIDIIESFKELDEKKTFGISRIEPVKIISIQNLVSKKNKPFISMYVCDVLNYIVQVLIFGEDALTFEYKIGDNVQLRFDNQNVSTGKYLKGVLKIQIVLCKFEISLLKKDIKPKIDKLSNVENLTLQGQKYFNFIVKIVGTEKNGSKPFKKHEIFDKSGTAMLVEWNSYNYKGLTFNIEPNDIYLIMSAEVTIHERYGISLQNYVIIKPLIFPHFESCFNQLKNITKQSNLNITKDSFENIGTTNSFNCIKYQKISKYNNIILYDCELGLIDVGVIHGKKEDGTYVGITQLDKLEVDEYNQLDIEYGIKINIIDENQNIWEDGYINNKIATKLLNIQPKDFWDQNDKIKNNIFAKMLAKKYNIFINLFKGKNDKIKFKICYIDVNEEEEYDSNDDDNDNINVNGVFDGDNIDVDNYDDNYDDNNDDDDDDDCSSLKI